MLFLIVEVVISGGHGATVTILMMAQTTKDNERTMSLPGRLRRQGACLDSNFMSSDPASAASTKSPASHS